MLVCRCEPGDHVSPTTPCELRAGDGGCGSRSFGCCSPDAANVRAQGVGAIVCSSCGAAVPNRVQRRLPSGSRSFGRWRLFLCLVLGRQWCVGDERRGRAHGLGALRCAGAGAGCSSARPWTCFSQGARFYASWLPSPLSAASAVGASAARLLPNRADTHNCCHRAGQGPPLMYVCRWATAARGSGKPDRQAEPQDPADAQCRGRGGRQAPPVVSVGPYLSRSLRRKGVALSMLRCGAPGRPRASAAAFARRGVQGRLGGAVRHLW